MEAVAVPLRHRTAVVVKCRLEPEDCHHESAAADEGSAVLSNNSMVATRANSRSLVGLKPSS